MYTFTVTFHDDTDIIIWRGGASCEEDALSSAIRYVYGLWRLMDYEYNRQAYPSLARSKKPGHPHRVTPYIFALVERDDPSDTAPQPLGCTHTASVWPFNAPIKKEADR
jgi:hypothetical protein